LAFRPVDPRYRLFRPDLPPRDGNADTSIRRSSSIPRTTVVARGMPACASTGSPSPPDPRPIELQPLEPFTAGYSGSVRSRMAHAPIDPLGKGYDLGFRRSNRRHGVGQRYHGSRQLLAGGLTLVKADVL